MLRDLGFFREPVFLLVIVGGPLLRDGEIVIGHVRFDDDLLLDMPAVRLPLRLHGRCV